MNSLLRFLEAEALARDMLLVGALEGELFAALAAIRGRGGVVTTGTGKSPSLAPECNKSSIRID